jgi:hypothetical protein
MKTGQMFLESLKRRTNFLKGFNQGIKQERTKRLREDTPEEAEKYKEIINDMILHDR